MIGGEDIVIDFESSSRCNPEVLDLTSESIRRHWPDAVIQDATLSFGRVSELFIYRDKRSFETWMLVGENPDNANAMIHLLLNDCTLTLVVNDQADSSMAPLIEDLKKVLGTRDVEKSEEVSS